MNLAHNSIAVHLNVRRLDEPEVLTRERDEGNLSLFRSPTVAAGGSDRKKTGEGVLEYKWSSADKESKILNTRQETYAGNTPIVVDPLGGGYTTKNRGVDAILSLYLGTLKVGLQPTEDEAAIVNGFRSACEDEIRQLRSECQEKLLTIQTLCQELVCLEARTADIERHVAAASSILAPLRRLPIELLSRIFQLTIPERGTLPHPSESPLLLCRVSRVWRNIVVNDPTLWSQTLFEFPDEGEYMDGGDEEADDSEVVRIYDSRLQVLDLFACRSRTVPFNLSIDDSHLGKLDNPSMEVQDCRDQAHRALHSLFPKCRSLDISMDQKWGDSVLAPLSPDCFSSLQSLVLRLEDVSMVPKTQLFSACPLRHYELRTAAPVSLSQISVPHQKLATFVVAFGAERRRSKASSGNAVAQWLNFIAKCPNLRSAEANFQSLRDSGVIEGITWNFPPYPTLNLTSLTLKVAFGGSASTILRNINFPALRSLHLHAVFSSPFRLIPLEQPFTASIQRDMPYFARLTSLSLTHVQIRDADLFALLLLATQLEALSVLRTDNERPKIHRSGMDEPENLISFLTHKHHEPPVDPPLPNLVSLRLNYPLRTNSKGSFKVLNASYSRLIRSRYEWNRRRSGAPLRHEGVSFESSPFKMHLTVGVYYGERDQYHKVKAAMEEELGTIHSRVLRMLPCVSPVFDDQPDLFI